MQTLTAACADASETAPAFQTVMAVCPSRVDLAHVDDSASASCEADDDPLASRRVALIEWWLDQVGRQLSAPVRAVRAVGDPASQLARLSRDLDLLVIGTRGRDVSPWPAAP